MISAYGTRGADGLLNEDEGKSKCREALKRKSSEKQEKLQKQGLLITLSKI